jgi:hypothetical protein
MTVPFDEGKDDTVGLTPQQLAEQARRKLYALAQVPDRQLTGATTASPANHRQPLTARAAKMVLHAIVTFLVLSALTTPTSQIEAIKIIRPLPFVPPGADTTLLKPTEQGKVTDMEIRQIAPSLPTISRSADFRDSHATKQNTKAAASRPRPSKQLPQ